MPLEALNGGGAPVAAAIVHDPEDTRSGAVGLLGHHLVDEPAERVDAGGCLATPDGPGARPRRRDRPARRRARTRAPPASRRWGAAHTRLDAGLGGGTGGTGRACGVGHGLLDRRILLGG